MAWLDEILPAERRLPLIFGLIVDMGRLGGYEPRVRLVELRLIDVALDAEELAALGDERAVLVIDRFQIALDPGDEIHGIDRLRVAGQLEIERHRLLQGLRDDDLLAGRRDVGVSRVAAGESERANRDKNALNRISAAVGGGTKLLLGHVLADPSSQCSLRRPGSGHRDNASRPTGSYNASSASSRKTERCVPDARNVIRNDR